LPSSPLQRGSTNSKSSFRCESNAKNKRRKISDSETETVKEKNYTSTDRWIEVDSSHSDDNNDADIGPQYPSMQPARNTPFMRDLAQMFSQFPIDKIPEAVSTPPGSQSTKRTRSSSSQHENKGWRSGSQVAATFYPVCPPMPGVIAMESSDDEESQTAETEDQDREAPLIDADETENRVEFSDDEGEQLEAEMADRDKPRVKEVEPTRIPAQDYLRVPNAVVYEVSSLISPIFCFDLVLQSDVDAEKQLNSVSGSVSTQSSPTFSKCKLRRIRRKRAALNRDNKT
jgi:hypothetical protein